MEVNLFFKEIYNLLDSKGAEDIIIYDIVKFSYIADYLILCTGNSETHINALSGNILKLSKDLNQKIYNIDGYKNTKWVSIDFGDIILHVMGKHEREFYNLESIWGDCERVEIDKSNSFGVKYGSKVPNK